MTHHAILLSLPARTLRRINPSPALTHAQLQPSPLHAVSAHGPLTQAAFLQRMGLRARVAALKAAAPDDARRTQIDSAVARLVDPTGMGAQYKVMALTGKRNEEMDDGERWPFVDVDTGGDTKATSSSEERIAGSGTGADGGIARP